MYGLDKNRLSIKMDMEMVETVDRHWSKKAHLSRRKISQNLLIYYTMNVKYWQEPSIDGSDLRFAKSNRYRKCVCLCVLCTVHTPRPDLIFADSNWFRHQNRATLSYSPGAYFISLSNSIAYVRQLLMTSKKWKIEVENKDEQKKTYPHVYLRGAMFSSWQVV